MRSSGWTSVDDDLAAGRGRETDEARDLDVVRADPEVAAAELGATPWMCRTFEPTPSMSAPIETRKRQRSWMCGSHAA